MERIKLSLVFGICAGLLVLASSFLPATLDYKIDPKTSTVKWTGYHIAKSYEHFGTIQFKKGNLVFEDGNLVGGKFTMNMHSIKNSDLTKQGKNEKLVKHLKSDEFFYSTKYPTSTLEIKEAIAQENDIYNIKADLTIRDTTNAIEFLAKIRRVGPDQVHANAKLTIDRTRFNVMYGWSIEDVIISDEFKLDIELFANRIKK